MLRASVSRIALFVKCKKSYDYKYNQKLQPKKVSNALSKGKMIHGALELYDKGGDVDTFLADLVNVIEDDDVINDIREVVYNYMYTVEANNMRLNVIENEIELKTKLAPGINYLGFIDGIVQMDDGKYILERKTYSASPPTTTALFNTQVNMYRKVYGDKIKGVIFEFIKSTAPKQPKILKSGDYSLDKSQRVTPYTLSGHPNVPVELYEVAEGNQEYFVRREVFHFSDVMNVQIVTNFIEQTKELKRNKIWTRSLSEMVCGMCSYKDLCFAELQNGENSEEALWVKSEIYTWEEEENERVTESQETE